MKRTKFIVGLAGALAAASFLSAPSAIAGGYVSKPAPVSHMMRPSMPQMRPAMPRPMPMVMHAPRPQRPIMHHEVHFGGRGYGNFSPRPQGPIMHPRFTNYGPRMPAPMMRQAPHVVHYTSHQFHQLHPAAIYHVRQINMHSAPVYHANMAPRPMMPRPMAMPPMKAPMRMAYAMPRHK